MTRRQKVVFWVGLGVLLAVGVVSIPLSQQAEGSALTTSRLDQRVELLASAARTATGNGSAVRLYPFMGAVALELDLTAAATDAADTLDVYVQTMIDGTNYVDVEHFTQCVGNGGAKRYFAKLSMTAALTEFENGSALGAAAKRDILGDRWRVRWAITDADTDCSFTFSVSACPM
jgi:hypothetical protein